MVDCLQVWPRFLRSVDTAVDANVHLFGTMHLFTILSPKLKMVRAFSTEQKFIWYETNLIAFYGWHSKRTATQKKKVTRILLVLIILLRPSSIEWWIVYKFDLGSWRAWTPLRMPTSTFLVLCTCSQFCHQSWKWLELVQLSKMCPGYVNTLIIYNEYDC